MNDLSHMSTRHIVCFLPAHRQVSIYRSFPYPIAQPMQDLLWQGHCRLHTIHARRSRDTLIRLICFVFPPARNGPRRTATRPFDGCPYVWYPGSAACFYPSPIPAGDPSCSAAHRDIARSFLFSLRFIRITCMVKNAFLIKLVVTLCAKLTLSLQVIITQGDRPVLGNIRQPPAKNAALHCVFGRTQSF